MTGATIVFLVSFFWHPQLLPNHFNYRSILLLSQLLARRRTNKSTFTYTLNISLSPTFLTWYENKVWLAAEHLVLAGHTAIRARKTRNKAEIVKLISFWFQKVLVQFWRNFIKVDNGQPLLSWPQEDPLKLQMRNSSDIIQ